MSDIDIYNEDLPKIGAVLDVLQKRIVGHRWTSYEQLSQIKDEIETRFYDAGYIVKVDVSPILAGYGPDIAIEGRVVPMEFDPERPGEKGDKFYTTDGFAVGGSN